jgi:hypothetical protein
MPAFKDILRDVFLILVIFLQAEAVSRVMAVAASTADSNDMSDILFHDSTASVADFNRIIRQVLRAMEIGVHALDCAPWPKVLELAKQKRVSKEGIDFLHRFWTVYNMYQRNELEY